MESVRSDRIEEAAKKQAQKSGLPYFNLKTFPIDPAAVFTVNETDAHAGSLVVISKKGKNLGVAVLDPDREPTKKILKQLEKDGFICKIVVASETGLAAGWKKYALKKDTQSNDLGVFQITGTELASMQDQIKDVAGLKDKLASLPLTKVLNILIAGALKVKASDIHFEPAEKDIRLRYRLDGVLYDIVNFPTADYKQLLSRIKLMSGLKINIHESPQDGRFTIRQGESDIEVRVSILPGAYGENIVMRILDPSAIKQKLEDLGMRPDVLETVKRLLEKTTGAVLTTGPTGSGKTTTLYAFIKHINNPEIKIITVEDPIEYHITGISQTQVDVEAGYTFAGGLRSIVRQDPDAILVGEIRDGETAEIAMQAALTGHLVFSTLHTNDAAGAIPRLIDLGVKPVTIAPAVNVIMAQRLVRKLCPDCKKKSKIKAEDLELAKKLIGGLSEAVNPIKITENMEIYYPSKCAKCDSMGYKGRIGVYELFEIDNDIEKLILKSPAISEIRELAVQKGMLTLLQDGLLKVIQGVTSFEEVLRVIGE